VNPVIATLDEVFASVPHTMFCVKDVDGRYLAINQAFAERAGRRPNQVLGRTARDFFPADLVDAYEEQDRRLLATGEPIRNELEMILRPDGSRGWYVTSKTLLRDRSGAIDGIVVVSYDLRASAAATGDPHSGLQAAIDLVRRAYAQPLKVADLAKAAGLSPTQLERATRKTLGVSPKQLLIRTRIDEAVRRLDDTSLPLVAIAGECGFYDQSSFTRQFQRAVGLTPGAYRARQQRG
jgi:PAS domain S-box-containing protein